MEIETLIERLLDLDKAFGLPQCPEFDLPSRVATVATSELLKRLKTPAYVKPEILQEIGTRALSNLNGGPTDLQQYSLGLLSLLYSPSSQRLKPSNCKAVASAAAVHLTSKVDLVRRNVVGVLCGCVMQILPNECASFAGPIEVMLAAEFTDTQLAKEAQADIRQLLAARISLPKVSRKLIQKKLQELEVTNGPLLELQAFYMEESSQ